MPEEDLTPSEQDSVPVREEPLGKPHDSFTKRSVVVFIIGVIIVVALVTTGVVVAIVSNQSQVATSQQQWCDTLTLLTKTPVPAPADPKSNPSREATYELYLDFVNLKSKFHCV